MQKGSQLDLAFYFNVQWQHSWFVFMHWKVVENSYWFMSHMKYLFFFIFRAAWLPFEINLSEHVWFLRIEWFLIWIMLPDVQQFHFFFQLSQKQKTFDQFIETKNLCCVTWVVLRANAHCSLSMLWNKLSRCSFISCVDQRYNSRFNLKFKRNPRNKFLTIFVLGL